MARWTFLHHRQAPDGVGLLQGLLVSMALSKQTLLTRLNFWTILMIKNLTHAFHPSHCFLKLVQSLMGQQMNTLRDLYSHTKLLTSMLCFSVQLEKALWPSRKAFYVYSFTFHKV